MQDRETEAFLQKLDEEEHVRKNRIQGIKTVLVVLSSRGMVFDVPALKQKILLAYPDSQVFVRTTLGVAVGEKAPSRVDLLLDFTGPRQRQGLFYSKKLRRTAKVAIGRNAGFFRGSYDRIFDEKKNLKTLPTDLLARERQVQKQVLALAGIPLAQSGDTPDDIGKSIALKLPSMAKL
ncbi:hypothetical protein K2X30_03690 [bacterium]|nr:hypothetical protein [bacterium]